MVVLLDEIKILFQELNTKIKKSINIYTDGSCLNNGMENAVGGIGIYFDDPNIPSISKQLDKSLKQTNNVAELFAIMEAYKNVKYKNFDEINIYSDSTYAISCCMEYGKKIVSINKIDAPNFKLIKEAQDLFRNQNVNFIHIKAHTNLNDEHSKGNSIADKLANDSVGLVEHQFNKIYLKVNFNKKDYIKSLGGRWDNEKKLWYILSSNNNKQKICKEFVIL